MDVVALAGAVSAGASSAVVTGTVMHRWWRAREVRQQAAFRAAVQDIVNESVADVITRQSQFERRQGAHLDRQDRAIRALGDDIRRAAARDRTEGT